MIKASKNLTKETTNDIKKVAKGAGVSFVGSIAGRGLMFASQVIIARYLGAEIFGLYVLGLVVVKMTGLIARLGLQTGAMKFVSIYRKDNPGKAKGTIISSIFISFIMGIFIGVIVYFSSDFISEKIFHDTALVRIIRSFAICIPFMATIMVISGASRGFQTTKYSVYITEIIQPSVYMVLVLILVLLKYSIFWIINAYIISHLIAVLIGLHFITKQFPEIKNKGLKAVYENKKLLHYSLSLLIGGFLLFLMSWTDAIMLGHMKTSTDVGIYRAASQIPILLLVILNASNSIYAPTIAEMYHKNQMERLSKIFKTTTRFVFFLTFPASLILVFSARDLLYIFGADYVDTGISVLIILTISQLINCVTAGVGLTLSLTGKQNITLMNNLGMIIINLILNYFFISAYGVFGAALATAISIGAVNLIQLLEVYIIYKIHPYNISFTKGVAAGLIVLPILYFLNKYTTGYSSLKSVMVNAAIVGTIFLLTFFIMGLNDEDRILIKNISKKFNLKSAS